MKQTATPCAFTPSESWVILSPIEQSIKRKIESVGTPLKDWDIQINYGIKTGCNEAFIIDEAKRAEILSWCHDANERKRTEQIIRPILRGRDIKRYGYNWAGLYLLWIPWHFPLHLDESITGASAKAESEFNKQFPAVYKHLCVYKEVLSKRNQSETGIRYEWYALQRWGANYWDDFAKPKIVWGEISDRTKFAIDANGDFMQEATTFLLTGEILEFLLCFLNSPLSEYLFSKIGTTTGVGTVRWKKFKLEQLCVPRHNIDIQFFKEQLAAFLKTGDTTILNSINRRIYTICGLTEEEIEFIESP